MGEMDDAVRKAKKEVEEGLDFKTLWEPSEQGGVSGNIFTDETKDPDKKYATVYDVGDIDVGGDVPGVVKKGIAGNVAEAIQDLQEAAATLAEIGDGLDNVGKAVSCKACGGKVSLGQRNRYRKLMAQRGWTPESHKAFWSKISSGPDEKSPGGHRACVANMTGKTDDPHGMCSWAEAEATGHWPEEHQPFEQAARKVRKSAAGLARQASELRKAMRASE